MVSFWLPFVGCRLSAVVEPEKVARHLVMCEPRVFDFLLGGLIPPGVVLAK